MKRKTSKRVARSAKPVTHGWEGTKTKKPPFHGAAAPFQKGKANPRHSSNLKKGQ